MNYPVHLLPNPRFKIIEKNTDLAKYYLIRHTPNKDIYTPGTTKVDFDLIKVQSNHLGDFSTNLLGIFKIEDKKYRVKGENEEYFNSLWNGYDEVTPPIYNKNYDICKDRGCFFIKIDQVVGQVADYTTNGQNGIKGYCRILHTPTNCNFWHFSLRWFNEEGIDIRNLNISKSQRRKFYGITKAIIAELAFGDPPNYPTISKEKYMTK